MIEVPDQWVEMAWAARDASVPTMNAARRAWFERVKRGIGESDLPKSVICPATNVMRLKAR